MKSQKQKQEQFKKPPAQIVVVLKDSGQPLLNKLKTSSKPSSSENQLLKTLTAFNLELKPLFADTEEQVLSVSAKAVKKEKNKQLDKMNSFYTIDNVNVQDAEKIVNELNQLDLIDGAYIKPLGEPPVYFEIDAAPGSLKATGNDVPITQDLTGNQTYLNAAPVGVDARYAWTIPGGRGDGVNIIDIEGGWNFSHEDLLVNSGGLIQGFNLTTDARWFDHGTAVMGEIGGDTNTFGVTGISPNARLRAVSVFTNSTLAYNSAAAIRKAADSLSIGDVILIEQHRGGPNYPGGNTQLGFIAIEWWPDDFLAIQYATSKGIIVVEAAGNGSQDLNSAIHNNRPTGFPSWWSNPFNRSGAMDSGAILVGAGAPPPGTNGGNWGVDRSRLGFSNYGSCVDTQGWGSGVTTTGYGDIRGTNPNNQNEWYTNFFSGTSSASPIITGVVASLQGTQRAKGRPLLTPKRMRDLLRSTGSPQQAGASAPVSQRIGTRPDLRQLIQSVVAAPHWCGVQFTGQIPPLQSKTWFTHSWPDNWQTVWTVVPTAPIIDGNAQIEFSVSVDRQAFGLLKYFITIKNLTVFPVTAEARFCVLAS